MPKPFKLGEIKLDLPRGIVLLLLVLNLVAGWFVFSPFGVSAAGVRGSEYQYAGEYVYP